MRSLGVLVTETPGEAYEVAEIMTRATVPEGGRCAIVTHSGGVAILLSDLAERRGLDLPTPGEALRDRLQPLLDHGVVDNPLDLGGIVGGPHRFADAVQAVAGSGEYDIVLAVSSPHSPNHSESRTTSLLGLDSQAPVIHLWMAGSQAAASLNRMRMAGIPITEEPRAAVLALTGLTRMSTMVARRDIEPIAGDIDEWGLPLIEGIVASSPIDAARAAETLGFPVVLKVHSPHLAHKTDVGGVILMLDDADAVQAAFSDILSSVELSGQTATEVRVERFRPGLELMVGAVNHDTFGPIASVGFGGTYAEVVRDVVFALGPVDSETAMSMVDRLRIRPALEGFRGQPPADIEELAEIISTVSRGLAGSDINEVELNPLIWDGSAWVAVDWLVVGNG
jgi:acetyltransferase